MPRDARAPKSRAPEKPLRKTNEPKQLQKKKKPQEAETRSQRTSENERQKAKQEKQKIKERGGNSLLWWSPWKGGKDGGGVGERPRRLPPQVQGQAGKKEGGQKTRERKEETRPNKVERRITPPFLDGRKYEGRKRGGVRGGNRSVDRRYGIARAAAEQATDADRYGAVDPDRKGKKKRRARRKWGKENGARA